STVFALLSLALSSSRVSALTRSSLPAPYFPLFFFTDPATTAIYTLSLHDALPIYRQPRSRPAVCSADRRTLTPSSARSRAGAARSEEHTSELQSRGHLVCRLLLEKKKKQKKQRNKRQKKSSETQRNDHDDARKRDD